MKLPSVDDMEAAAAWLAAAEGSLDAEGCKRVAAWLEHQADLAALRSLQKAVQA